MSATYTDKFGKPIPTAQEFNALAEEREAKERERRAEQQAESDAALEYQRRVDAQRKIVADQKSAEREAVLAPWEAVLKTKLALVRRAAEKLQDAELKSTLHPLDVGLATDALGAERCLVRLQLRLDSHLEEKP